MQKPRSVASAGVLKELLFCRWMLFSCIGCSISISDLEDDIYFFRMFFILEGKMCKVQVDILSGLPTLEVLLHHSDGSSWQGICCQTSSIQYFSSATSCGNIIVLFKDLHKVKILSTLPRQILEQDLWLFCLTSLSMFTVSDIYV